MLLIHPLQPSNPLSYLITPVSAGGHPLPHQRAAAPFINHTQPAIAVEWCSAGVEKHRGRANSLNTRLAVITDKCDTLWILFALAAVVWSNTLPGVTPNGFCTGIFTREVT